MSDSLKLNLGCGKNKISNYLNVDKLGDPDLIWDLEKFPWPWDNCSVEEILLHHVLEHLGETTNTYIKVIKELYRIGTNGARILISVPHPRHDDFITDPTHVRQITPEGLELFSKKANLKWINEGFANSPLAIYYNVDFDIKNVTILPDPKWEYLIKEPTSDLNLLLEHSKKYNNVIKEYRIVLEVVKE